MNFYKAKLVSDPNKTNYSHLRVNLHREKNMKRQK